MHSSNITKNPYPTPSKSHRKTHTQHLQNQSKFNTVTKILKTPTRHDSKAKNRNQKQTTNDDPFPLLLLFIRDQMLSGECAQNHKLTGTVRI
jgi:hypothetical protein